MKLSKCLAWYRDKYHPTLTIKTNRKKKETIKGEMESFTNQKVVVITEDGTVTVTADEILTIKLRWVGNAYSGFNMPETDGSGNEQIAATPVLYKHLVTSLKYVQI